MTGEKGPDRPVDEPAGLVKFSQLTRDQTARSMRKLDLKKFQAKKPGQPAMQAAASQPGRRAAPALSLTPSRAPGLGESGRELWLAGREKVFKKSPKEIAADSASQ